MLVWAILPRGIAPTQPVAVDENDAAQHSPVINPWLAMALGKIRFEPRHLLVGQPVAPASTPLSIAAGGLHRYLR